MACDQCRTKLPRGLRCDRGYLMLTVEFNKRLVAKPYCGPHTKASEMLARERLSKIRSEIFLGRFGHEPDIPEKTFDQAFTIWFELWKNEKDGSGVPIHNERSIKNCLEACERNLLPYFGRMKYHEITPAHIDKRRFERIAGKKNIDGTWAVSPVSGTTVNREHVPLSAMFSDIAKAIKAGKIEAFKIPMFRHANGETAFNPCEGAQKADMRVHERILTDYEIAKLRSACLSLQDFDGWSICKLMLTTVLSLADMKRLEVGQQIDMKRAKTGASIKIPLIVLDKLNWTNWDRRWDKIRAKAGFSMDRKSSEYVDAKVLRKTGMNWMDGTFSPEQIAQYAANKTVTTKKHYLLADMEKMKPLAQFMQSKVEQFEK